MRAWKQLVGCTLAALALCGAPAFGQVVISQVYGGGGNSGATYTHDFVELFNRGSTSVSLDGWSVQYASAGGTFNVGTTLTPLPNVSIPPGGYYLIQLFSQANVGSPLPTPDHTGTTNLSGSSGKVALANTTTALGALAAGCTHPNLLDLVGYGTANCFESAPTPVLTNTSAAIRVLGGCQDTNHNANDFSVMTPNPRNSATPLNPCTTPTGACCNNFVCTIDTQAACEGAGGAYQGNDTLCTPGLCGAPPTGACCNFSSCEIATETDCESGGGVYQGDETTCEPNPCTLPCNTIGQARAIGSGPVRLCDVIVSSEADLIGTNKTFFIQDASGALTVFGSDAVIDGLIGQFDPGDSITIEGSLSTFNGLLQLTAPFNFISNNGFVGVPELQEVTAPDFAEASPTAEGFESELVIVRCVTFVQAGQPYSLNAFSYTAVDENNVSFTVRVATGDLGFDGLTVPVGPVNVSGVFSQFDSSDPRNGGYQLLPRSPDDVQEAPECNPVGACCGAGGSCTIVSESDCMSAGGTYQGDDTVCAPDLCPGPLGACCIAADGTCSETTEFNCTEGLAGSFQGNGTTCTPNNCPQPSGACCLPNGMCSVLEIDDCAAQNGTYVGNDTTCSDTRCPENVLSGDIALGLSQSNAANTAHQVRNGMLVGQWNDAAFLQSMEFDNAGGLSHNADGNLLAANFGAPVETPNETSGGELYNLSTDGSDRAQRIYHWNTLGGGVDDTRIGGISVSPTNSHVAAIGFDSAEIYVLEYNAGSSIGTGEGASIGAVLSAPTGGLGLATQGTTWLDNDTVVAAIPSFAGNLQVIKVDVGISLTVTVCGSIDLRGTGSLFTEVEYNPAISPFLYVMQSALTSSVTQTTLHVLDPLTCVVLKTVILDVSHQTGREMALGNDLALYSSQYAGSDAPQPKVYLERLDLDLDNDGDIDLIDTLALADNSSVDYYTLDGGVSSSHSGMDVALSSNPSDPCAGITRGDSNGDGTVNNFDIDPFVDALTNAGCTADLTCRCRNDINCDGIVNNFDIDPFVECLTGGCPPCE